MHTRKKMARPNTRFLRGASRKIQDHQVHIKVVHAQVDILCSFSDARRFIVLQTEEEFYLPLVFAQLPIIEKEGKEKRTNNRTNKKFLGHCLNSLKSLSTIKP